MLVHGGLGHELGFHCEFDRGLARRDCEWLPGHGRHLSEERGNMCARRRAWGRACARACVVCTNALRMCCRRCCSWSSCLRFGALEAAAVCFPLRIVFEVGLCSNTTHTSPELALRCSRPPPCARKACSCGFGAAMLSGGARCDTGPRPQASLRVDVRGRARAVLSSAAIARCSSAHGGGTPRPWM